MDKIIRFVTTMLVVSFSVLLGSSAVFADEVVKYSFLAKVPDIGVIHFSSCTGMGSESEVHEKPRLDYSGFSKVPGIVFGTSVVCKRPMLPKSVAWEWHKKIVPHHSQSNDANLYKNILIVALDNKNQEMAWWHLLRAWPSKVVNLYDGESLIEEVVLVSDSTQRLNSPNGWDLHEPPIPGLSTVEPPKVEMATGYVAAQKGGQQVDLSGRWTSNIGLIYQISQNGSKLSYQDPMMHKPVNGTVDGKTVTVSWTEGNAVKNLKGTITSMASDNRAKTISWANGVIFQR